MKILNENTKSLLVVFNNKWTASLVENIHNLNLLVFKRLDKKILDSIRDTQDRKGNYYIKVSVEIIKDSESKVANNDALIIIDDPYSLICEKG